MDLEINNPDDNPSVFQYDLPPGTILQAHLWVLLRGETKITVWDGQNAFPADGEKPEKFYESVLFGMLTRVNREEQTFVLFAEHCGYVHCNWMKSDPIPPEVPLGSMVRVLSSDTDSYIDPYNSVYAAYPPHPYTACALYELRCQADQVKKSFAAHEGL